MKLNYIKEETIHVDENEKVSLQRIDINPSNEFSLPEKISNFKFRFPVNKDLFLEINLEDTNIVTAYMRAFSLLHHTIQEQNYNIDLTYTTVDTKIYVNNELFEVSKYYLIQISNISHLLFKE